MMIMLTLALVLLLSSMIIRRQRKKRMDQALTEIFLRRKEMGLDL